MTDINTRPEFLARDSRGRAEVRRYGFSPTIITAATEASANVIGFGREAQSTLLSSVVISNVTNQEHQITVLIVPDGQTKSDNYAVLKNYAVPAYDVAVFKDDLMLNAGDVVYAYASTANAFRISGWVTAYL